MSIAALIDAVEAGTATASDFHKYLGRDALNAISAYNIDMNAAMALHEALLPNRYWTISEFDGAWTAQIPVSDHKSYEATDEHSAARAWLLAILRAKEAGQ